MTKKTRTTKSTTAKRAPKASPKKTGQAPVVAKTPATPAPGRMREDVLLSLSTVDPATVPGCRAMFRYAYDAMAKLKKPIPFADLVARVDSDPEYHTRSKQEVRGHVRQLVARLRQWGLVVVVSPAAQKVA